MWKCKQKSKRKKEMFLHIRKPYFLGIDFGTSLIKAVELTLEDSKPKLVKYGQVDLARLERGIVTDQNSHDDEEVLYLRALLNKLQPKSDGVYAAMPAFTGLISLIELPEMNEDDLKEAIQFEAHKYIPSSLEDVALSWEVVGKHPSADGSNGIRMEILLVAALNKEVARYQKYIQATHLKMNFLELETFSLVRSVIHHDPGTFLVVDIGSRATNLVLVDDGLVKASRNLDVGGRDVTKTLTDAFNIAPERAEALKKSEKDLLNTPESALLLPSLEMIASEAKRMIGTYQEKYPDRACQGVVLSGGTAQMTGLIQYYSKLLGLPVRIGSPWDRISYDPEQAADIQKLGASFSVALGLALVGIDESTHAHERVAKKPFSLKAFLTKKM